jgi:hypothetical protein
MITAKRLSDFPGAVPDARQVIPVTTTAASTQLSAASGSFSAADVGKKIVIAGAGASGKKLSTTIAAFVNSATVTLAAPASTAQSTGGASLGTDCSAALQAALNALASDGGGTLIIDGQYLLTAPVSKNFINLASAIELTGYGSASALFIACADTQSAIQLANLLKLNVHGIDFVGTPGERNDAKFVLDLQACLSTDLDGNRFFGLANIDGTNCAVVYNYGGGLNLLRNYFGGCMIGNGGVVTSVEWQRFESNGNRFIDFGNRNGVVHSKTGFVTGHAWIKVGDPLPSSAYESGSAPIVYSHATLKIDGDIYDEGTKNPVLVQPPTRRLNGVRIAGCRFNVNGWTAITTGPAIFNTEDVSIEHCSMGYFQGSRYAIYLHTLRHARITGVTTNGFVNTVKAYNIDWLEIVNSPALTDLSLVNVTRVTVDGLPPPP